MGKIGKTIKMFKADWNNHLIAFISTIFGIIIAFQLQNWQKEKIENERLQFGIESIKNEIKEDFDMLDKTIKTLEYYNGYTSFIEDHLNSDETIICTEATWDSLRNAYSNNDDQGSNLKLFVDQIFAEINIKRKLNNNSIEVEFLTPISFFIPKIHTDSWEAIKFSGLLTSLPYDKLTTLTRLYGELSRNNSGTTPDDFMIYVRNNNLDIKQLTKIIRNIKFDYEIKRMRIDETYQQIMNF